MAAKYDPEGLWEDILSRDGARIRSAWERLSKAEQDHLIAHLERMVREQGWHAEQVTSAQKALDEIHRINRPV